MNALPITGTTSSFTLNWLFSIPSSTQVLSAQADVTVTSFSDTQLALSITLDNTTVLIPSIAKANILVIGLNFDPTVTQAMYDGQGDVFGGLATNVNFPGGFIATDVCAFAANNCQGGNVNQGLTPGSSDTFDLLLTRTATRQDAAWNLLSAPIKFQTSITSYEFQACTLTTAGCVRPPARIPEPGVLALLGALVIGFGATHRLRRRRIALH